jgi:hypothetical protein
MWSEFTVLHNDTYSVRATPCVIPRTVTQEVHTTLCYQDMSCGTSSHGLEPQASKRSRHSATRSVVDLFIINGENERKIENLVRYECRCDERLKSKTEGSTHLTYTGLCGELEHLKIKTRLTDER